MKSPTTVPVNGLVLDRASPTPLSRQIADLLREQILTGQIGPGVRLPATRMLAEELAVSRNTTLLAYDMLTAEGYLEGKVGAGTTVARVLPDTLLRATAALPPPVEAFDRADPPAEVSRRLRALANSPRAMHRAGIVPTYLRAFESGLPDISAFPHETWARLVARRVRRSLPDLMAYQDTAGYRPLREAIAAYLGTARGVRCTSEQIMIVSGSQGGLDLVARVLLDAGDAAWVEDPGYPGIRGALVASGARIIPVPIDAEGLDLRVALSRCPEAKLAYVTPSHQYPLGGTMSLSRRLALLDWAARAQAWIVEDDYDGEFRYRGRPLPALQGLRPDGRVVYLGTFSKVLFPALRIGYLIIPPALVDAFRMMRRVVDTHPPALEQAVLADFIAEGHFARHIRRMRTLYAARARTLVEAAQIHLKGLLDVVPPSGGLNALGWLPPGMDDRLAAERAAVYGVSVLPISNYALEPLPRGGFMMGFSEVGEAAIHEGARRLGNVLRSLRVSS